MLKVKLLTDTATAPTLAHAGEDIAYDIYADEDITVPPQQLRMISTGVAIEFTKPKRGAIFRDRSSMAKLYAEVRGGVIDAGYRGELKVMIYNSHHDGFLRIKKGEKFVQMLPFPVAHDAVKVVPKLSESKRGDKGFGSSGNNTTLKGDK